MVRVCMLLSGIWVIFVVWRMVLVVWGWVHWVVRLQVVLVVVGHDSVLALAAKGAAYFLVVREGFEHILVFLIHKAVAMAVVRRIVVRL